jgi:hypothetical protein
MQEAWAETPVGGSPEAERLEFERLGREIMRVQLKTAKTASAHGVPHGVDRAFHAKSTLAVDNAELRFLDLPADLRAGFAQPGASYSTVVRFSNASGIPQADTEPDLRGVALRVQVSPEETHDLLMTNYPVSHARDANQFVEFAKATAGGGISRLFGIVGLLRLFGLDETKRMLKNVREHGPDVVADEMLPRLVCDRTRADHPEVGEALGLGQEHLALLELLLRAPPLHELALQVARALLDALLEQAARVLQVGVALLDAGEHVVEGLDELAHLVAAFGGDAHRVVLFPRDPAGSFGVAAHGDIDSGPDLDLWYVSSVASITTGVCPALVGVDQQAPGRGQRRQPERISHEHDLALLPGHAASIGDICTGTGIWRE